VTLVTPLYEFFSGVTLGLSVGTCFLNLKSVALTDLELLAFNNQHAQTHRHTQKENSMSTIHLAQKMNDIKMGIKWDQSFHEKSQFNVPHTGRNVIRTLKRVKQW